VKPHKTFQSLALVNAACNPCMPNAFGRISLCVCVLFML